MTATVWEGPKDFNDATTPEVKGYTPDRQVVSNKDIAHDHADIVETVTYTPEIQKLDVTYHDDTTNTDLKKDEISGNTSTVATKDGNRNALQKLWDAFIQFLSSIRLNN